MKVGNSTIHFNTTISASFKNVPIVNVPYWRLYAKPGDCIGPNWKSDRSLTYEEIMTYLTKYKGHRVLEAMPRKTRNTYGKYMYDHIESSDEWYVVSKETGEILCIFDKDKKCTYLSSECKSHYYFARQIFGKDKQLAKLIAELTT